MTWLGRLARVGKRCALDAREVHTPAGMITLFRCVEISVAEISNTSRIPFPNILMLKIYLRLICINLLMKLSRTFLSYSCELFDHVATLFQGWEVGADSLFANFRSFVLHGRCRASALQGRLVESLAVSFV